MEFEGLSIVLIDDVVIEEIEDFRVRSEFFDPLDEIGLFVRPRRVNDDGIPPFSESVRQEEYLREFGWPEKFENDDTVRYR
ncbi:MAG: hypothetical protein QG650_782 [Patescibacteria group bacterium]|nr:hypothetical protein [Patescibacteria group bacterium]